MFFKIAYRLDSSQDVEIGNLVRLSITGRLHRGVSSIGVRSYVPYLFKTDKPQRFLMQEPISIPADSFSRMPRQEAQIVIHLSPSMKAGFDDYANKLWLGPAALVKLLINRELKLKRLLAMKLAGTPPTRPRQRRGAAVSLPSIAARFATKDALQQFDAYATDCGLNRDSAGAWLLQEELRERWLEKALLSQGKPLNG